MRLKNKRDTPEGGYQFLYYAEGAESKVLVHVMKSNGPIADPISQLTEDVRNSMRINNIPIPDDLETIVEHQICLRQSEPSEVCYSGGIGDDLHHRFIKPFLINAADRIESAIGAGALKRFSSAAIRALHSIANCTGCAGTRIYDGSVNNLGRAGKLNRITHPRS